MLSLDIVYGGDGDILIVNVCVRLLFSTAVGMVRSGMLCVTVDRGDSAGAAGGLRGDSIWVSAFVVFPGSKLSIEVAIQFDLKLIFCEQLSCL